MADRYWVGGTGNWDATTTHWSATSGGAAGASVPTSADNVIFNSASGSGNYTVTISASSNCLNLTAAGTATGTLTITGAAALGIYGGLSYSGTGVGGVTHTANGNWTFRYAGSTPQTVTTNGVSLNIPNLVFGTASGGGSWVLGSALTNTGTNTNFVSGTFDTAGYSITSNNLLSNGTITRTINLNNSTVTVSGTTPINFTGATNLTFNAGTSQINITNTPITFNGAGFTYYNVSFTNTSLASIAFNGANTFNNLTIAARTIVSYGTITFNANQTINGTFTAAAATNGAIRRKYVSGTLGTQVTLTAAAVTIGDIDFQDIIGAGAATWSGTRLGNVGNNSGITFPAAKTVYWVTSTTISQNISAAFWSTSSGGSTTGGNTTNWPLPQDTCVFDNSSCGTGGTPAINMNVGYSLGTLDFSALTKSYGFAIATAITLGLSGNLNLSSTVTTSTPGAGTLSFQGRTGTQQFTSAGTTYNHTIALNNIGCTVQLQDNLTMGNLSIAHNYGTFDANNKNVTNPSIFASNSGNTRTLNLGSGTWTFNNGGSAWIVTSTGLTLNSSTSTLKFTSASDTTFAGGGMTYATLSNGGAGALTISGNNSFDTLINTVSPATFTFTSGSIQTITNWLINGTAGNLVVLNASTIGSQATISSSYGTVSADYLNIQDISAAGGAFWYAGANSVDSGDNSGWIFTVPPVPTTWGQTGGIGKPSKKVYKNEKNQIESQVAEAIDQVLGFEKQTPELKTEVIAKIAEKPTFSDADLRMMILNIQAEHLGKTIAEYENALYEARLRAELDDEQAILLLI